MMICQFVLSAVATKVGIVQDHEGKIVRCYCDVGLAKKSALRAKSRQCIYFRKGLICMPPVSLISSIQHLRIVRICIFCNKNVERDLAKNNYALCRSCLPLLKCRKPKIIKR